MNKKESKSFFISTEISIIQHDTNGKGCFPYHEEKFPEEELRGIQNWIEDHPDLGTGCRNLTRIVH